MYMILCLEISCYSILQYELIFFSFLFGFGYNNISTEISQNGVQEGRVYTDHTPTLIGREVVSDKPKN